MTLPEDFARYSFVVGLVTVVDGAGDHLSRRFEVLGESRQGQPSILLSGLGQRSLVDQKDWDDFAKYENQLNAIIHDRRIIVVCTYPFGGRRFRRRSHPPVRHCEAKWDLGPTAGRDPADARTRTRAPARGMRSEPSEMRDYMC